MSGAQWWTAWRDRLDPEAYRVVDSYHRGTRVGGVLVECGVHKGYEFLAHAPAFDRAIGFEADAEMADACRAAAKTPNVEVYHLALALQPGPVLLHRYGRRDTSSLLRLSEAGRAELGAPELSDVTVPAEPLGLALDRLGVEVVRLLTTDIQGMDAAIVESITEHLRARRVLVLITELQPDGTEEWYPGAENWYSRAERALQDTHVCIRSPDTSSAVPPREFDYVWALRPVG